MTYDIADNFVTFCFVQRLFVMLIQKKELFSSSSKSGRIQKGNAKYKNFSFMKLLLFASNFFFFLVLFLINIDIFTTGFAVNLLLFMKFYENTFFYERKISFFSSLLVCRRENVNVYFTSTSYYSSFFLMGGLAKL
jgi:hypothetical protein